jgi:pimeloyl-ACP methyl ester carboxylesterase
MHPAFQVVCELIQYCIASENDFCEDQHQMPLLNRPDVSLYFQQSGHGPPVLLIQGVGVAGNCWRPQVEVLAKDFQTIIFDNRGLGRSEPCTGPITIEAMAEDARALMDGADWESAHIIGHSMGGVIAQQLALDCPKRVRSLSLLCTFACAKDAARLTPWVLWMTLRTRIGTRRMRRRAFLEMLWSPDALESIDTDELATRVSALVGRDLAIQPQALMKQVQALSRHDTLKRLGELRGIPSLVMSAEHDPIALPNYGRMLAERIPGAQFELVSAASHGVTIQKSGEVSERLHRWLMGVEAQRAAT